MGQKANEPSMQSPRGEWAGCTSSGWLQLEREKVEDGFEALVAELSARFINLPANQLDDGIEEAQRQICEQLHLDRSALF